MKEHTELILDGTKKRKLIPLNEFFISYRKTRLKIGQFIYSIKIRMSKDFKGPILIEIFLE